MPYKDKNEQRDYQAKWIKDRRNKWITSHGPCLCGSTDRLTVVSVRDMPGAHSNHFWSYSDGQMKRVLRHYQVKCFKCFKEIQKRRFHERYLGRKGYFSVLTPQDVWAIRGRLLGFESMRAIARDFHIDPMCIQKIRTGKIHGTIKKSRRKVFGINL